MANIKYEIFCNRKGFNVVNWVKLNSENSYEDFKKFLNSKSVIAPSKEYFQKVLDFLKKENQEEDIKVIKKETIPIDVEISLPEVKEDISTENTQSVEEEKPKTRRRRKKKEADEN